MIHENIIVTIIPSELIFYPFVDSWRISAFSSGTKLQLTYGLGVSLLSALMICNVCTYNKPIIRAGQPKVDTYITGTSNPDRVAYILYYKGVETYFYYGI